MIKKMRQSYTALFALVGLFALAAPPVSADGELTLRLNDAEAVPGGIAVLVVRTYESRPVGQGQFCFQMNNFLADPWRGELEFGVDNPFEEYLGSIVFSSESDARHRLTLEPGAGLEFLLEFMSPTATINDSDGPIVVHYLKVRSDVSPGERYNVGMNFADTWLLDDSGASIPIEIRAGELLVKNPAAPLRVEADADEVRPGGWAAVALETVEWAPLSGGEVTLIFDSGIATGDPVVEIDPRIGQADFTVDNSVPGRTVVSFDSPDATLNKLPGSLIQFRIPTRPDVPLGTESVVRFAPESTLLDRDGAPLDILFETGVIEFVND